MDFGSAAGLKAGKLGSLFPTHDEFGIRYGSLLTDTDEDQARRAAAVEDVVRRALACARLHLGEDNARALWNRVNSRPAGRPRRPADPGADQMLLNCFDKLCNPTQPDDWRVPKAQRVNFIGRLLNRELPGRFGASEEAIAKRLRRLIERRDQVRRRELEFWRKLGRLNADGSPKFRSFLSELSEAGSPAEGQKPDDT